MDGDHDHGEEWGAHVGITKGRCRRAQEVIGYPVWQEVAGRSESEHQHRKQQVSTTEAEMIT